MAKHNGVRRKEGITVAKLGLNVSSKFGGVNNIVGIWYGDECRMRNHEGTQVGGKLGYLGTDVVHKCFTGPSSSDFDGAWRDAC